MRSCSFTSARRRSSSAASIGDGLWGALTTISAVCIYLTYDSGKAESVAVHHDQDIEIRTWKTTWQAEKATLAEARALKKRLLKPWRNRGRREREVARIVGHC